jgi:hypothetical protein
MKALRLILALAFAATATAEVPAKYQEIFSKLRGVRIEYPCEKSVRKVERLGDNTISLESFVCLDADFAMFKKIAGDIDHYGSWLLDRMNEKPDGGTYFIKFTSLQATPEPSIKLGYRIDIPFFKKDKVKTFRVRTESEKGVFVLSGEGVEDPESYMHFARSAMYAFPSPGQAHEVWVYVEGKTKLKNSLLYQAMPEKMLKTEAGDRIGKILENYQAREAAIAASNPARSSLAPK